MTADDATVIDDTPEDFEWAIVEIMGHRRLGGQAREVARFGSMLLRIDVPRNDGTFATKFYGGSSIFSYTPCDEATARKVAEYVTPPVGRLALDRGYDEEEY